ncbi:thiol peroxidase [Streptococcus massiliensis]|uniref:Thiol peroxidase n=1 Tax=Streptococcus massiliensis TaxID=313439 RepID=A0A380L139_9STRE|nr:thiol peroxidase [Streptococcus massiliensis]SUN77064.1 thiol peroxidase [Streptococcus massiliensis]
MTTFLGNPVTFTGKQPQVGDTAPDFSLTSTDLSKKTLADFAGKKKVLSIIPSIDTDVCSTQTRHFNQGLSDLDNTVVITISVDLPFAQGKWCAAEGIENAVLLSDYFDHSFGRDYAVLINEWHLLARAVLVLDENNKITYAEYVDNINSEPDYQAAINAIKNL